jgi:hypothetical protein
LDRRHERRVWQDLDARFGAQDLVAHVDDDPPLDTFHVGDGAQAPGQVGAPATRGFDLDRDEALAAPP